MRISDWSSDVCSSDLGAPPDRRGHRRRARCRPATRRGSGAADRLRSGGAMMATAPMTRWWWIRHAPVIGQDGRLYGTLDVDCDCTDAALFRALAARLPDDAVWIVTPLRRTRATAAAIARHHPARSEEHTSELQSLMRITY